MHYFDSRGVKRLFLMTLEGSTWTIWRAPGEDWNGPDGPGFNQRYIGEISADGRSIAGRWERGLGDAGDEWELDFPFDYVRVEPPSRGTDLGVPPSRVDRPASDDPSALCHDEVVDEVDHRADVVGHDPDDRADRRPRRPGRQARPTP